MPGPPLAPKPKLLDRVRWHLRLKHYSIRTEQAYTDWIRRYILFHGKRHPEEMGEEEIAEFLTYLAVEKHVAASTQNQALSALLFLYQQVLDRKLDFIDKVERVKRPPKIPVVFTRAEARAVLAQLKGDYRLMVHLLYRSGLRLLECLRLRVKDIDFGYRQITVRESKGMRERVTSSPNDSSGRSRPISRGLKTCIARTSPAGAVRFICPLPFTASIQMPHANGSGSMLSLLISFLSIRAGARSADTMWGRKICKTP
jgi:integrase